MVTVPVYLIAAGLLVSLYSSIKAIPLCHTLIAITLELNPQQASINLQTTSNFTFQPQSPCRTLVGLLVLQSFVSLT